MSVQRRQRACIVCAKSKRRCDRQLPECQRCLDRDVDCLYSRPKRRKRDLMASDGQTGNFSAAVDLVDWGALGVLDLDMSLLDATVPSPEMRWLAHPLPQTDLAPVPWFLQHETWVMQQPLQKGHCPTTVEYDPFIAAVQGMLHSWVREGHNGFIHRRLYQKGMPTCLQQAFTTLAAYISSTPAVKTTILQIAEEHAGALLRKDLSSAGGVQGILNHLARVQALFVYAFIRLFDGSVRLRASAEQQIPMLRLWVFQMWDVASRYRIGDDDFYSHHHALNLSDDPSDFDQQYHRSLELWELWIVMESVRRSHIIIDSVANFYETVTKGWIECSGAVMFTAASSLWDAESAMHWSELSCTTQPLLVPSLEPEAWLAQHTADDLDEFVKVCWACIIGTEKIQSWVNRRSGKTGG